MKGDVLVNAVERACCSRVAPTGAEQLTSRSAKGKTSKAFGLLFPLPHTLP